MDTAIDTRGEVKSHLFREVLRSFGEARLAVTGASMLPSIWPGDILEVRRQSAAEICPGQLVLFARGGGLVAHRVVSQLSVVSCQSSVVPPAAGQSLVATDYGPRTTDQGLRTTDHGQKAERVLLVTRGDRLRDFGPPVSPEELLGVVTAVVRNGRRLAPRLTRWGRIASWVLSRSDLSTRIVLHLRKKVASG
jgi:hypothetical protein